MSSPNDDFNNAVSDIVDSAKDKAEKAVDTAKDKAEKAADTVSSKAGDVADQVKKSFADVSGRGNEVLEDPAGFLRRQMRDRPWMVVGVTALLAFALGMSAGKKGNN